MRRRAYSRQGQPPAAELSLRVTATACGRCFRISSREREYARLICCRYQPSGKDIANCRGAFAHHPSSSRPGSWYSFCRQISTRSTVDFTYRANLTCRRNFRTARVSRNKGAMDQHYSNACCLVGTGAAGFELCAQATSGQENLSQQAFIVSRRVLHLQWRSHWMVSNTVSYLQNAMACRNGRGHKFETRSTAAGPVDPGERRSTN